MPAYGKVKVDTITYDLSGTATDVSVSNIATKASPTFTGTVTIPTPTAGDNSTKAASTAFVVASFATKASPTFTGTINAADLVLSGDLTVNGSTTTIDTTTLQVEDKNIQIGKVSTPSDATADGGGLTLLGATNKTWNWVNSTDAWTSSEHIHLPDNKKLFIGTSAQDLSIYHDSTNSYIDSNQGSLLIRGADGIIKIRANNNEESIVCNPNAAVEAYHNGVKKLETSATGCTVTGTLAATAVTGDGSGLTNLPPGGNTIELVADGAIAAGKPVILTSAGKVKQIAQTVTERTTQLSHGDQGNDGSQMSGDGSGKTFKHNAITFSETSSTGGFFFRNYTTGNNLECRAFNLHSTTGNANIPSAANVTVLSDDYDQISGCWEATNNKFIIVARKDSDYKTYMTWVSVSANTITASGNTFDINNVDAQHPKCCDCGSGRVAAITDVDWNSGGVYENYLTMYSWSGSNYTEGNGVFVAGSGTSSNPTYHSNIAYHVAEDKIIAVYHNASNNVGCKIGTISGTGSSMTTSWGSEVTVASAAELPNVIVDVNTGKVVVTYVYTSSNAPYSKVGTISGTSISFGTEALVDIGVVDANDPDNFRPELIYLKNLQKVIYAYVGLYGGNYYTVTRTGTVSGTSISWTNQFQHWPSGVGIRGVAMVDLNNASKNKFVLGGRNDNYSDKGVYKTIDITEAVSNLTDANDCIGFSSAAYSDGQTATIKTYGNTIDNLSGLTIGSLYYIQGNGTLGTTWDSINLSSFAGNTPLAGMALSATKLLIREPRANN